MTYKQACRLEWQILSREGKMAPEEICYSPLPCLADIIFISVECICGQVYWSSPATRDIKMRVHLFCTEQTRVYPARLTVIEQVAGGIQVTCGERRRAKFGRPPGRHLRHLAVPTQDNVLRRPTNVFHILSRYTVRPLSPRQRPAGSRLGRRVKISLPGSGYRAGFGGRPFPDSFTNTSLFQQSHTSLNFNMTSHVRGRCVDSVATSISGRREKDKNMSQRRTPFGHFDRRQRLRTDFRSLAPDKRNKERVIPFERPFELKISRITTIFVILKTYFKGNYDGCRHRVAEAPPPRAPPAVRCYLAGPLAAELYPNSRDPRRTAFGRAARALIGPHRLCELFIFAFE
ncbi:hypothetical protein EVAR_81190_1 [Eumeta japonica]|uniref:Uncharacterized protein n=1 Tax=Eumeta variegata TaxID=151549 RepID=A0A4C1ULT3_EUMVA|nr:hypothetical protein EVAR_81190_1 [Eumeta japonica]